MPIVRIADSFSPVEYRSQACGIQARCGLSGSAGQLCCIGGSPGTGVGKGEGIYREARAAVH
jgi:hypothetical protein